MPRGEALREDSVRGDLFPQAIERRKAMEKYYAIKPKYADQWEPFIVKDATDPVPLSKIREVAVKWTIPLYELMEQVREIPENTRYFKTYQTVDGEERIGISYPEALWAVLGTYRENDMSMDMLDIPNHILCRYSVIDVEVLKDGEFVKAPEGNYNLNGDAVYDEYGGRIV